MSAGKGRGEVTVQRGDPVPRDFATLAALVAPATAGGGWLSLPDAFDWPHIIALAARHRVLPALADAVRRNGTAVPDAIDAALCAAERQAVFDEMAQLATLGDIVLALESEGVAVVVLKGVPLSLAIHGRLGMRTSRDIDLLVAPEQVDVAFRVLASLGFVQRGGSLPKPSAAGPRLLRTRKDIELLSDARRQIVELHWRLFDNRTLMPFALGDVVGRSVLPTGTSCSILPERPNIAYLAVHGAQHGWSRLKWLCDLMALLGRMEPGGVAQTYQGLSIREGRRALAQALVLANRLFGWPLPVPVERDHARDWRIRMLVEIALRAMTASGSREMEALPFGSTAKNLSHYLLRNDPAYLVEELRFDLFHAATDRSQRWPTARLGGWLTRHLALSRRV